ncbi:hypothetical protein Tco_0613439, partial [Tanacetum coccineum]
MSLEIRLEVSPPDINYKMKPCFVILMLSFLLSNQRLIKKHWRNPAGLKPCKKNYMTPNGLGRVVLVVSKSLEVSKGNVDPTLFSKREGKDILLLLQMLIMLVAKTQEEVHLKACRYWVKDYLRIMVLFNKIPLYCDNKSAIALCCNNNRYHADIFHKGFTMRKTKLLDRKAWNENNVSEDSDKPGRRGCIIVDCQGGVVLFWVGAEVESDWFVLGC